MLELFHIITRFTIRDGVSRGLTTLSGRFTKADKAALKLQKRIDKIKTTMLAGAGMAFMGGIGLFATARMLKPASEYLHTLAQANAVGMKHVEVANLIAAAWTTTAKVQSVSITEAMQMGISLRRILGSTSLATMMLPQLARLKTAYVLAKESGSVGANVDASKMVYSTAKAAEMAGRTSNRAEFSSFANNMMRVVVGTAGKVTPTMYMGLLKYARGAGIALSDKTLFRTAPILMEEMALGRGGAGGGARGGPGSVYNAWNRMLIQGVMTKSTLGGLRSLGLITGQKQLSTAELAKYKNIYKNLLLHPAAIGSASQKAMLGLPLIGGGMAGADPVGWIFKYLEPALRKAYPTLNRRQLAAKSSLYFKGNSLAAWLASNTIAREFQIKKEMRMLGGVPGTSALMSLSNTDPNTAYKRVGAQWANLMTTLGKPLMTMLIPALNKFADSLHLLALFFKKNQVLAFGLVASLGALSAAMAIGGVVLLLRGAFMGLGIALEVLTGIVEVGAMATGIGEIALALGALYEVVTHWKGIIDAFKKGPPNAPKTIPLFEHLGFRWSKKAPMDHAAIANSSGISIRPHTEHRPEVHVLMDGKKVGKIVAKHMGNEMSKTTSNQKSNFDIGLNLPGINYGF